MYCNMINVLTCLLMRLGLIALICLESLGKQQHEEIYQKRLMKRTIPFMEKIKLKKLNLIKQSKKPN